MSSNSCLKKTLVLCLVVSFIFSVLSGCSNNSSETEKPDVDIVPEASDTSEITNEPNPTSTSTEVTEKPDITVEDSYEDITIFCGRR